MSRMTDQPRAEQTPRDRAADEIREVVLDGLREQQPPEWNPDDGVDESGMDYESMVDVVARVLSDAGHRNAAALLGPEGDDR